MVNVPPPPDETDEGTAPSPEKNWERFIFPRDATPEDIARILMESIRAHADDHDEDDGGSRCN